MPCHEKEREQEDAYTKTESHSNPIPTSLFVCYEWIRQRKEHILTSKCLPKVCCGLERNKDVGMGL